MTNSADPDQLASSEANWSGSTLFAKTGHVMFSKRRVKADLKTGELWKFTYNIYPYFHYILWENMGSRLGLFFFFFFQEKSFDIFLPSQWKQVMDIHYKCLTEGLLMSTHKICFHGEFSYFPWKKNKKSVIWEPPLIWRYGMQYIDLLT